MRKQPKKQKNIYLTDKYVTSILLRDIREQQDNEKKIASDELAKCFLEIQKKILTKPNFKNYYNLTKENMISRGSYLFLTNWYKFKPYRSKNNFQMVETVSLLTRPANKIDMVLYVNREFVEFDLIELHTRTYSVKECIDLGDGEFQLNLYNKLKCDMTEGDEAILYSPKYDLFENKDDVVRGGFTLLTTFAFTAAKDSITAAKKEKERREKFLESYNHDIFSTVQTHEQGSEWN
jgi:hypothetical protein